jgi:hypothetical protein
MSLYEAINQLVDLTSLGRGITIMEAQQYEVIPTRFTRRAWGWITPAILAKLDAKAPYIDRVDATGRRDTLRNSL